jgi:hypothetical protein
MDISGVPANLVNDWLTTLLVANGSDRTNLVALMQMTDAQKVTSLTTYLQNRAANDQTQINNLTAAMQNTQDALNADISACNAAVQTMTVVIQ